MNKIKDYSQYKDKHFGMLKFTGKVESRGEKVKRAYGTFICDCGKEHIARMDTVLRLDTQSCGCVYHDIHVSTGKKNIIKAIESCKKQNEYSIDGNVVTVRMFNTEKVLICDLDDWNLQKEHCWSLNGTGYAVANIPGGKRIMFHRVAMNARDGIWIDHKNRNRLDCRKKNLREATPLLNAINYTLKKNNTSGYSGVSFDRESGKWRATIRFNNKVYRLGRYADKADAIKARQMAEEKYFKPILTA